jgi:hypothetical protein
MTLEMKLALILAPLLGACASPTVPAWTKGDSTDAEFRAAMGECRSQAAKQPLTPKPGSRPEDAASLGAIPAEPGVSVQDMADFRRAVAECLSARGWSRR